MRTSLHCGAYAAALDEDYKVAECRQGKMLYQTVRSAEVEERFPRITYAPLALR